jgi:hypothetical protein
VNPAQHARIAKEERPQDYCPRKGCLWKIVRRDGSLNPCMKHPTSRPASPPATVIP